MVVKRVARAVASRPATGGAEKVGVVGLGYVGLPLAVAFAQRGEVIGFDINRRRVEALNAGIDITHESDSAAFGRARLTCTTDPQALKACTAIIVAVPTPVNKAKQPDLDPLVGASTSVAGILQPGMLVVYESTVYPGVTEDVCLPILEQGSGLKLGDFDLGYSPERVNPGDREHRLDNVIKVVSGHDAACLKRVSRLYSEVAKAGVHEAPSIKTAEAAKVIENIQRDLNIALMNELSKIFSRCGLHTNEVLAAAGTKWNFHRYTPGLVGGHCIGVDPYYMTHLAMRLDLNPRVILAGREINDSMGEYVANLVLRELSLAGKALRRCRVLLMGLTFKEDVPDYRNSRAEDVIACLRNFGVTVYGCEPLLDDATVADEFHVTPAHLDALPVVDAVVIINRHRAFTSVPLGRLAKLMKTPLLFDLKNLYDREQATAKGIRHFSL
ncbi:MAG: UDP-N-acetyl-D-glucosamine 6-dehydrogenase [Lentisphaerae bacterium ADurb.BinA184]|nr:MAG: UDP-N-acetyl-D-glucosamine 6-dehydrogenase [Lentisphaerae bacterium ADurb.BinA184]